MQDELRSKQALEATKRMKAMNLLGQVRKDFQIGQKVYYSERQSSFFPATLYWLSNNEKFSKLVKDFESKYNSLVYHCQLTHMVDGDLLSIFYVSPHEDEWSQDYDDILNGQALVRVENLMCSDDSEFGYVGFQSAFGGIVRTW